jgi:hypothetical protein
MMPVALSTHIRQWFSSCGTTGTVATCVPSRTHAARPLMVASKASDTSLSVKNSEQARWVYEPVRQCALERSDAMDS